MQRNTKIISFSGSTPNFTFITDDYCPICKTKLIPKHLSAHLNSETEVSVFNYCVSCKNTFISQYFISYTSGQTASSSNSISGEFIKSIPVFFTPREFESKIISMSGNFSKVYNQAKSAETMQLNEIAGMGYRKSLEILIKDYAIFLNPEDKEKILNPKFTLNSCIEKYIKADNLKDVSKLTSWLGNDESHYTKIHTDKNIIDLKEYLEATIYFIMYDLTAKKAFDIINQ